MSDFSNKILVTGATGMLGAHLVSELVSLGYTNIVALYRSDASKKIIPDHIQSQITWFQSDILDPDGIMEAMNGVIWVFHCAGVVSYSPDDSLSLHQVNVEGTELLLNVAIEKGIKQFCHVSSIAALGKNGKPITEDTPWEENNSTLYGKSKRWAEMAVYRANAEGLKTVIVNPSIILGPGIWDKSSPSLFTKAWNGLRFSSPGQTGFVDVRDVASFMIMAMEKDVAGEKYLLSAENISYVHLFQKIASSLGVEPPSKVAKPWMAQVIWRLEKIKSFFTRKKPLITKETAKQAFQEATFDATKSKKIGFEYRSLDKTIKEIGAVFLKTYPKNKAFGTFEN